MVDTLALLKNDYTEAEAFKLLDEINTYIYLLGGDGAHLLKSTENMIYYVEKEDFIIPIEVIKKKISPEFHDIYDEVIRPFEAKEYTKIPDVADEEKISALLEEYCLLSRQYREENGGYETTKFEPNKYVIIARLTSGAWQDFEGLLNKMGVNFIETFHWYEDEFRDDAFVKIDYEPKNIPIVNYFFWLKDSMSKEQFKDCSEKLINELECIRYGLYVCRNTVSSYCAKNDFYTTKGSDAFSVSKGQQVIILPIIEEDMAAVQTAFEKVGFRIETVVELVAETACFDYLEHIW